MKNIILACIALLVLNVSVVDNKAALKLTPVCNIGIQPGLQAYCFKKLKKEKLRYIEPSNVFKAAINNSLHFITGDGLQKLFPVLKL